MNDDAVAFLLFFSLSPLPTKGLRTLLSVDDLIQGIHHYLDSVGEWERTYFLFTSDHGYNLGQFRVDSDKTQVRGRDNAVSVLVRARARADTFPM